MRREGYDLRMSQEKKKGSRGHYSAWTENYSTADEKNSKTETVSK